MKLSTSCLTGLVLASLLGCSTFSAPPVPPAIKLLPPASLLQPCPQPSLLGNTVGDLAKWAVAQEAALAQCNADKAALRGWAEAP